MKASRFSLRFVGIWAACVAAAQIAWAVPVHIAYMDQPSEGFKDPTLGAARKTAFEYAVNIWASQLVGTVPIVIRAEFNWLEGDEFGAVLGSCGARTFHANFPNAPMEYTYYVSALANQLAGIDLAPSTEDLDAEFNSLVDGDVVLGDISWYYGLDGNPPGNDIDFVTVVLHEMGHGLGFLDLIDPYSGEWYFGDPDIFSLQLAQYSVGLFGDMSDEERYWALTSDEVIWIGGHVRMKTGQWILMYAPDPYEFGSSIAHWDISNFPDLLMEPYFTHTIHTIDLTKYAFQDLGWTFTPKSAAQHWTRY